MFALVLLIAAAPAPPVRSLPDFQPGRYRLKWGAAAWGTATFEEDGLYYMTFPSVQGLSYYYGKWSWDRGKRQLTITECRFSFVWDVSLSVVRVFQFAKKLDRATGESTLLFRME